jgi:hypothetical protein
MHASPSNNPPEITKHISPAATRKAEALVELTNFDINRLLTNVLLIMAAF